MRQRDIEAVLDSAPDGVLIEEGERVVYINAAFASMLGYPSTSELTGATVRDIAHPEDLDRLRWFGVCRASGKPAPTRYMFRARGRGSRIVTLDASVSTSRVGSSLMISTFVREQQAPERVEGAILHIPGTDALSAREHEIIASILRGERSKEIALRLDISEKTVFTHRSRAYRKLSVRSDRELFRIAADLGLI